MQRDRKYDGQPRPFHGWVDHPIKRKKERKKYLITSQNDSTFLVIQSNSVITNKLFSPNWSFYYINQPGYNETRL